MQVMMIMMKIVPESSSVFVMVFESCGMIIGSDPRQYWFMCNVHFRREPIDVATMQIAVHLVFTADIGLTNGLHILNSVHWGQP
mmetsp:Transcript_11573/g.18977  ORF Transcript_11573/g.18977 Transcript_11573/m.18977 type:complete len:84 (+) Transcript_11573:552-803(+)